MHRKNRFYLLILQTQHMKFHFCDHRAQNSSETKHISKENIQGLDGRCRLRVIGQIDRKYILCISTFDNLLIVVDQHAGCFVLLLHLVFLFSHRVVDVLPKTRVSIDWRIHEMASAAIFKSGYKDMYFWRQAKSILPGVGVDGDLTIHTDYDTQHSPRTQNMYNTLDDDEE